MHAKLTPNYISKLYLLTPKGQKVYNKDVKYIVQNIKHPVDNISQSLGKCSQKIVQAENLLYRRYRLMFFSKMIGFTYSYKMDVS